jgi:hypothetical protein
MPSSFTAAAFLPFRLLSRLHTPCMAVERILQFDSHPRRLHAHAAHRVPTPRADRPPCRPDTGVRSSRPSCIHSRAFSIHDAGCPSSRTTTHQRRRYIDLAAVLIRVGERVVV